MQLYKCPTDIQRKTSKLYNRTVDIATSEPRLDLFFFEKKLLLTDHNKSWTLKAEASQVILLG